MKATLSQHGEENNQHFFRERTSSLLVGATFARQRQAELSYPRRGAGGTGRPADRVGVVSLEQSLPLFGTGEL